MKNVFKKTQILILILLQINVVITAQTISKDNIENQIENGIIKSLTEYSYHINKIEKYGEMELKKSTPSGKISRSFDKKGRRISRIFYKEDGSIDDKTIYIYNDEENTEESIGYNSKGITDKWMAYYDKNGNKLKEVEIDIKTGIPKLKFIPKDSYKYNNNGKLLEAIYYKDDGSIYTKIKNIYLESGVKTEYHLIMYGVYAEKINFDNEGNKIATYKYDSDGDLESKEIFKYHLNGNLSKSELYYSDGTLFHDVSFDKNGDQTVRKVYDSDGVFSNQAIYSYEYEYDTHKNWIKKTEISTWSNDDLSSILVEERIIEYY